jgi:NADPH-dependent F420 reductase
VIVGVLGGTGPAGGALALRLASVGHRVLIGSRSAERAEEAAAELAGRWPGQELDLVGAANAAAAEAEVVIVATPWDGAAPTVAGLAEALAGKVVISMANALAKVGDELQALIPSRGSIAVAVRDAAPDALVAAAFHHVPARELGDIANPIEGDVLVCSDHHHATDVTSQLIAQIPELRPLDAGSLGSAGAVEAFTAVILGLNRRYRTRATLRLVGIET